MLINTVILFLTDLLPIFILFCLLQANHAQTFVSRKGLITLFVISSLGVIATFNFLPSNSEIMWDSSSLVEDRSEYGHLLNTLFGYEARPSFEFIMIYICSLLFLISYYLINLRRKFNTSKDLEGINYDL